MAAAALSLAERRLSLDPWQVLICIRLHNVPAPSGSQLPRRCSAPPAGRRPQCHLLQLSAPYRSQSGSANSTLNLKHTPEERVRKFGVLGTLLSGLGCPPTSPLTQCTPNAWHPPEAFRSWLCSSAPSAIPTWPTKEPALSPSRLFLTASSMTSRIGPWDVYRIRARDASLTHPALLTP